MPCLDRNRLHFGPYAAPHFQFGQRVKCLARGYVTITKLSDARIPWPVGKGPGGLGLVLCDDLAKAVRREAACAVMHSWGVG
jgi:hypothetical protein